MNKFTKYLGYFIILCIVLLVVFNSVDNTQAWVPIAKNICWVGILLSASIYIIIMIYCIIDNKKIDKYLVADDYDNLIAYANKKASKNSIILPERKNYYHYLLALCYFAKDDHEQIAKYLELLSDNFDTYPMLYYWKACYDFANNENENLVSYFNSFANSPLINKRRFRYQHLIDLLYVFVVFAEGKVSEAKERLEKADTERVTMPATKRAIDIVNNAEVEATIEQIEASEEAIDVIEEEKEDE